MVSTLTILIRAIEHTDGNFYMPLNLPNEDKPKGVDVSQVLNEIHSIGGQVVSSSFVYNESVGHKGIQYLAYVTIPVTKETVEKIQTWTFKQIKLD